MSPAMAGAARRVSLSVILPCCPFEAPQRTPSPLPQGISPSLRAIPVSGSPVLTARHRRLSLPDTCHGQGISCGLGPGRPRRPSLSGLAAQGPVSSPLQVHSRKGNPREPKHNEKNTEPARRQVGAVKEALQSAVLSRKDELQWWEDFSPEEQAEMRRVALNALQEWVESNQPQAEKWLDSQEAQDWLKGKSNGAQVEEAEAAACSKSTAAEADPSRAEKQTEAEASGRSSPFTINGHSGEKEEKTVGTYMAAEPLRQMDNGAEKAAEKGGNLFSRVVGSFDARLRGLILLNLLTFLYGSNVSVLKNSASLLDPATFAAGRFGIGSIAFLPWMWKAVTDPRIRQAGGELGFWASIAYLTQAVALQTSDAGRVSFLSTFTVIVVPLLAGLFGKKISPLTWVSAAAALAGVGLLESSGAPPSIGDLWALLSAVLFGVQMLRTEHHSRTLRKEDSMALIGLQMTLTAAASALWALVSHVHSGDLTVLKALATFDISTLAHGLANVPWWPMLYTGVFSTALCLWIEVVSLHDVSATEAALVYTIEPLWGAGFAWLLLGERWGPTGFAGAALILGGSMTTQLFGKEEEPASNQPAAVQADSRSKTVEEFLIDTDSENFDIDSFTRALTLYALAEVANKAEKPASAEVEPRDLQSTIERAVDRSWISREGLLRRVGHK